MTSEEICRNYRLAKDPRKQIEILADLNQTSKRKIQKILEKGGETIRAYYDANRKSRRPVSAEDVRMIRAMQSNGTPIVEIAKALGRSYPTIYRYVKGEKRNV